jgi:ribose/xylose/arabinose/galactoside ABC-type transport system permease subunit
VSTTTKAALSEPARSVRPDKRIPESVRATGPLLFAIVALGAYASFKSPFFLTQQNLENILQQISILGLIAIGSTFLMIAGLLDLSVGALAALVSVVGAKLVVSGTSTLVVVLACLALGVGASFITGWIVATARVAPFILTLGGMNVFLSLALVLSDGTPVPVFENPFSVLGLGKWLGLPASGVIFLGVFVAGLAFIRYARLSRNAFAIGANPRASFLAGVAVGRVTIALYCLSGLLVGAAGIILLGRLGSGDANAGAGLELQAIAAVVLGGAALNGGRGSVWGTFLGVLFLGEIANALRVLGVQVFYQQLVYGAVLIVAVVITALREDKRLPGVGSLRALTARRPGPAEATGGGSGGED